MKKLKKDVKSGISKSEAFRSYCDRDGDPKKGSRYLASIPDNEESVAYAKLNYGLIGIYIILFILGFLNILPMLRGLEGGAIIFIIALSLIIPIAIVWSLLKKLAFGYLILCFFLVKGILDSFKSFEQDPIAVYIGIGFNVLLIAYALYVKLKMFPFQNIINTKKDDNGLFVFQKVI